MHHPTQMHARSSIRARGVAATLKCAHGPTPSASGAQARAPSSDTTGARRCRNAHANRASTPTSASQVRIGARKQRPRGNRITFTELMARARPSGTAARARAPHALLVLLDASGMTRGHFYLNGHE